VFETMKLLLSSIVFSLMACAGTAKTICKTKAVTYAYLGSQQIKSTSNSNTSLPLVTVVQSAPVFLATDPARTPIGYTTTHYTTMTLATAGNPVGCIGTGTITLNDGNTIFMSRSCQDPETRPIIGTVGKKFPCGAGTIYHSKDTTTIPGDTITSLKVMPLCNC
jgi:hypothetical protein